MLSPCFSLSFCGGRLRRGRPRFRGLTPSPSARPSSVVSACPSPLPFVIALAVRHPMSGVLRLVRSYSPERRPSLWTPSAEPSRPRPRGAPRTLGASPSSVPVFFVLLPAVSQVLFPFPVVALLPVVFIPSRRNERLPRRDARGPCPGRDAIPGQRFGAAPSFAVIAERHGGQSAMPTRDRRTSPASAGCACVRRRRPPAPRPGASGPSGMAPASLVAEGPFPA